MSRGRIGPPRSLNTTFTSVTGLTSLTGTHTQSSFAPSGCGGDLTATRGPITLRSDVAKHSRERRLESVIVHSQTGLVRPERLQALD